MMYDATLFHVIQHAICIARRICFVLCIALCIVYRSAQINFELRYVYYMFQEVHVPTFVYYMRHPLYVLYDAVV